MKRLAHLIPVLVLVLIASSLMLGTAQARQGSPLQQPVKLLVPEVISTRPHDTTAYTEGLIYYNGFLYESTGEYGQSTLRKVDPQTGEVVQSISLPKEYFGEGLERVDNTLIQLTWQTNVAFVYDLDTFKQIGQYQYKGEGWGLCSDGRYLYMSDGTPFLSLRDRKTFDLIFQGLVTAQGQFVDQINELECVGDYIYANIWKSNYIIQINKTNGVVESVIDCTNLLTAEERAKFNDQEVLNGIVYLPDSDTFLITGKHWPKMYEVKFVEQKQ